MNIKAYDIECFKYDTLVTIKDLEHRLICKQWIDSFDGVNAIEQAVKDSVLVGYNNYNYDDVMLKTIRNGATCKQDTIKTINDILIRGGKITGKIQWPTLDCMQQIDGAMPSLKQIEGNKGKSIIETPVDFNIDRPLTAEERAVVEKYCEYDVDQTIDIYKERIHSYFEPKAILADMMDPSMGGICRWNTTTMIANILTSASYKKWARNDIPDVFWDWFNAGIVPEEVTEMWTEMLQSEDAALGKGKKCKIDAFGCDVVFGMGGLHGAPKKPGRYKDVKLLDVSSMYPSLIVLLGILAEKTTVYANLITERLKIKHTDKVRSDAYKLILNSTYGLLKNIFSKLYNPYASSCVCILGQIFLYLLCGMLYNAGYQIVNINTDGVAFTGGNGEYEQIWKAWEEKVKGPKLELDKFELWIQRDVNNYVARKGDEIKVKGGDVNQYKKPKIYGNANARVIHKAIVDKLLFNTPVIQTIADNLDKPELFQYILKAGPTYEGTCDESGVRFKQKVNRVFAAKASFPGKTRLYKLRSDGGKVLFPDAPENMFLYNGDVSEIENFKDVIDINHYIKIAEKRLEAWS